MHTQKPYWLILSSPQALGSMWWTTPDSVREGFEYDKRLACLNLGPVSVVKARSFAQILISSSIYADIPSHSSQSSSLPSIRARRSRNRVISYVSLKATDGGKGSQFIPSRAQIAMWLLNTDTAELEYFARHFDADGGYAILSHTWQGKEQTFQDVRNIGKRCKRARARPRDDPKLSPKIREFCRLAEEHGYRWAWADSCCIDKTSSSELSEAINSMYQWYSDTEVCYAYLADVPSLEDEDPWAADSAFRKSRWHRRGWTLQELIAPASLFFLSRDWKPLGSRVDLADLLKEITDIPRRIFTRQTRPSTYSVGMRMYWASDRQTTRVEDEAYCLMGLFGVSMPTNYGEGEEAFVRLQHEIMRRAPDLTLFAFGYRLPFGDLSGQGITLRPDFSVSNGLKYLLAASPRGFEYPYSYTPDLCSNAIQRYPPDPVSIGLSFLLSRMNSLLVRMY